MTNRFLDIFKGADLNDPFASMQRDFDRMLGDFRRSAPAFASTGFAPALDIHEVEGGLEVAVELPGVSEEDVSLDIHDDMLSIKGEKKSEKETKDEETGAVHRERTYGSFARSVRLPFAPDPGSASAKFADGVLTVTLPRPAEAERKSTRIAIEK